MVFGAKSVVRSVLGLTFLFAPYQGYVRGQIHGELRRVDRDVTQKVARARRLDELLGTEGLSDKELLERRELKRALFELTGNDSFSDY